MAKKLKETQTTLAQTRRITCSKCKGVTPYSIVRIQKRKTFLGIPLALAGEEYLYQCPLCQSSESISKPQALQLAKKERELQSKGYT